MWDRLWDLFWAVSLGEKWNKGTHNKRLETDLRPRSLRLLASGFRIMQFRRTIWQVNPNEMEAVFAEQSVFQ
jgi:hypothetical protein